MNLRTITIKDYEKLIPFWKKNYFANEMDSFDRFKVFLNKNPDLSVVMEENGEVAGTVTYAGEIFWGYGKYIQIDNGNNITSIYAHLSSIYVYQGEKVTLGQVIGAEGETGWATGPHLHFQINIFGIPVNPRTFLGDGKPN